MPKVKNAYDHNIVMVTLNRSESKWNHTLVIHGKGKSVAHIELTEDQFKQVQEQLDLKEEKSLTHDTSKVYIINP